MGLHQNGFRDNCGVFRYAGAGVSNGAYPSTLPINTHLTGAQRNITAGQGINSGLVSIPSGNRHPVAWMMPQKPGALAARNLVTGAGGVSDADTWAVKLAQAAIGGSGDLAAVGGLIVQLIADLSGSGAISDADLKAFLQAIANIGGSGQISEAAATGLGELTAAILGLGVVDATLTGTGAMSADLVVAGSGLTTGNIGQAVWSALSSTNNAVGSMGEKLNDAGSVSNPWTEVIESGYTAAEILSILFNRPAPLDATETEDAASAALTTYDPPTKAELDAAQAALVAEHDTTQAAIAAIPSAPSASAVAGAVRTELATELARVDASISTRLASAGYTAPLNSAATQAAAAAALDAATVDANVKYVNDVQVTGTGEDGDPWGPV